MSRDLIGFDIDDVLYPWSRIVYENVADVGESYSSFWDNYDTKYPKLYRRNIVRNPTYVMAAPIQQEDLAVLWDLFKIYDIVYVTGRPNDIRRQTEKWLKDNKVPNYGEAYIAETDSKNGHKDGIVKDLGCKFFVEDQQHNLERLAKVTNTIRRIQPWNKDFQGLYASIGGLSELPLILSLS